MRKGTNGGAETETETETESGSEGKERKGEERLRYWDETSSVCERCVI